MVADKNISLESVLLKYLSETNKMAMEEESEDENDEV